MDSVGQSKERLPTNSATPRRPAGYVSLSSQVEGWLIDQRGQLGEVPRPVPLDYPERRQVRRLPLHVDERTRPEALHEGEQRDLRGVRLPVEHRLPREQPADRQAVETADEPAVQTGLHRVRPAQLVEPDVRVTHAGVDPG